MHLSADVSSEGRYFIYREGIMFSRWRFPGDEYESSLHVHCERYQWKMIS